MVLIDFDRPGLDSAWGAAHKYSDVFVTCDDKYSDGFPMDAATMSPCKRFRGENHSTSSAASSSNMHGPQADFADASTAACAIAMAGGIAIAEAGAIAMAAQAGAGAIAIACACAIAAEASPSSSPSKLCLQMPEALQAEAAPASMPELAQHSEPAELEEDLANEKNVDSELQPEKDIELMTVLADQGFQADDQGFQEVAIACEHVPEVEDCMQSGEEGTKQKSALEETSTAVEEKKTAMASSNCWSFFATLLKPKPYVNPDHQRALTDDRDLERALLESVSFDEAKELSVALARVRLQDIMDKYQAKPRAVEADGNCQFRALAFQLHGTEALHGQVRAQLVEWLRRTKERYSDFVHEPYDDYLKRMVTDGEWGDNVTLQAASDMLCRDIHILNDQPGAERISLHPTDKADCVTEKPLWLAFIAELHYDAVEFL